MNLLDYVRILVRRGWIILLLALIAAGSAYVLTNGQTPVYRASQKVLMQPSRADLGLSEAIIRLMNSYAVYLSSSLRAAEVIEAEQLDTTPGDLQSRVAIEADTLRLFIQIDAEDTSEDQAKRIALAYGQLLVDYRTDQNQRARREDRVDAVIQDVPTASVVRPRPTLSAAAGGVLGLLVGGVIIFILEFIENNIIRRREELERGFNLAVLATVPVDMIDAKGA